MHRYLQLSPRSTRTALYCRSILLVFLRSCSSINNKIISFKNFISPQPVGGSSKRKKNPVALGTCPLCPLIKTALVSLCLHLHHAFSQFSQSCIFRVVHVMSINQSINLFASKLHIFEHNICQWQVARKTQSSTSWRPIINGTEANVVLEKHATKQKKTSLDFVVNRLFLKLFKTSNIDVKCCQDHFGFDLPSVIWSKRLKKFEA